MRDYLLVPGAALLIATGACSESSAQPGPEISRTFAVGPFSSIETNGSYDVVVTTGKAVSVSARGTQRLVESIRAEVRNGKLIISPETKGWKGSWDMGRTWARITVSVPALTAASLKGSGDMTIDRVQGRSFNGSVAGSGDLEVGRMAVGELQLSVAGSGGVKAAGQAQKAAYSIAGSGDVDVSQLTASQASASVAGSGGIRARVTGTANASIMGSGDIDISGGAKCQSSKMGSGSIRCS
jgi:hypothetical protein